MERQKEQLPADPDLDTIKQQIGELKAYPALIDVWQNSGQLSELQASTQHQLARSASDLTTGIRWKNEQVAYEDCFAVYKDLIETVALYETSKVLAADPSDADGAKRTLLALLEQSKTDIVESDINRRLEISAIERIKKKATQSKVARVTGTLVVAATVTALGSSATEALPDFGHFNTLNDDGLNIGIGFIVGTMVRSQLRKGPIKLGEFFKQRLNSSISFYDSPELHNIVKEATRNGRRLSEEQIHEMLSEYHLRHSLEKLGLLILERDLTDSPREEIALLVHDAVECTEKSLDEFYGMAPRKPSVIKRLQERRLKNETRQ